MRERYEEIYNTPDSTMKVDQSWERYLHPKDRSDHTPERYRYSVGWLYGDVLDVGAGDGFGAYQMTKNKKIDTITCLEIQDKAIAKMREKLEGLKNIKIVKGYAENILIQGRFDSVHCGHTLEHVLDERAALENLQRMARDIVVISVPINGGINRMHFREYKNAGQVRRMVQRYFDLVEVRVFHKSSRVSSVVVIGRAKI